MAHPPAEGYKPPQPMPWFLVPGLGMDARLFGPLQAACPHLRLQVVELPQPQASASLSGYAAMLARFALPDGPFGLLGVSFGGILAHEMAKVRQPARTVLVSAPATYEQIPPWFRWAKPLVAAGNLPWPLLRTRNLAPWMGAHTPEARELVSDMLRATPRATLQWGLGATLRWSSLARPPGLTHVHGTHDKVLPFIFARRAHPVLGAGHLLALTHPAELANLIGWLPASTIRLKFSKPELHTPA